MQEKKPGTSLFLMILYLLLAGAFFYAIYRYQGQIVHILEVVKQGLWYFVALTVAVLAVSVVNQAMLYASIYGILNIPNRLSDLIPLYLTRRFVTVAAPSGGFSGWLPFMHFARRNDLAVGAVFIANLIYSILWYSAFGLFLLAGLFHLFLVHDLQWFEVSAALLVLVADLGMVIGLILAWTRPVFFHRVLFWIVTGLKRLTDWLRRAPVVTLQQIDVFYNDLEGAMDLMKATPVRQLFIPVRYALLNEVINVVMLYLITLAFGVQIGYGPLIAVYAASILFFIVSPTPGGLGFVEGTLILIMTSLNISLEQATVITLAYRGITFWLPFALGFGALRWVNRIGVASSAT